MQQYVDGGGNLIAPDDRLYPVVLVQVGRDVNLLSVGRPHWGIYIAWGLRRAPRPGQRVYRRDIELTLQIEKR